MCKIITQLTLTLQATTNSIKKKPKVIEQLD